MSFLLGLPMWSNRDWIGEIYPAGTDSHGFLRHYAEHFETVEGNTTFYALPSEQTVASWAEQAPDHFRFSFKLPQPVTHRGQLKADEELNQFFKRLEPLGDRLGCFMVQLPAEVGESQLALLDRLLEELPEAHRYSVEVRNPVFFEKGDAERRLNQLLQQRGCDRVCFDSRALFSRAPKSEADRDAQAKKPKLPVHAVALGQHPMVRFIGTEDMTINSEYFRPWVTKLKQWCEQGLEPYVFIHTPSNAEVPRHAMELNALLNEVPGYQERKLEDNPRDQIGLF